MLALHIGLQRTAGIMLDVCVRACVCVCVSRRALDEDTRNFHAWNYRQFLVKRMNRPLDLELQYSEDKVRVCVCVCACVCVCVCVLGGGGAI